MNKILLVEDDILMQNVYSKVLTSKGFEVKLVKDGIECLAALKEEIPALILLDIMMPNMDGLATVKAIKANAIYKSIPIIVLSNLNSDTIITQAYALEINKFCIKSDISNQELVDTINEILAKGNS